MRPLERMSREDGGALLEVLIAGLILSIAVAGLALMFGRGQAYVVAQGDDRVALHLAEEKIEKLRAGGYASFPVGGPPASSGCPENEPCYSQTISAGAAGNQPFTRTTCVTYVDDTTFLPAPDSGCSNGLAQSSTKRIRVTVTSVMRQSDGATVDAVVTSPPS